MKDYLEVGGCLVPLSPLEMPNIQLLFVNEHSSKYIFVPFLLMCHFPLGGKLVCKPKWNDEILKKAILELLTRVVTTLWF